MRIGIFLFLSRRQVDFRKSEIASALPEPRAHCKGLKCDGFRRHRVSCYCFSVLFSENRFPLFRIML
jgi:hypothetical protein